MSHSKKSALEIKNFLLFYVDKLAIVQLTKDFPLCKSGLCPLSGETKLVNMFTRITLVVFVFIVMVSYTLSIVTSVTLSNLNFYLCIIYIYFSKQFYIQPFICFITKLIGFMTERQITSL